MPRTRSIKRPVRLALAAVAGGLLTTGLTACQQYPHSALVVGDGARVAITQPTIKSGLDTFSVLSNNKPAGNASSITLFSLKGGATLSRVGADLRDEFSQTPAKAARGTRELVRDINSVGLADITGGAHVAVTTYVAPGTYYLMDLYNFTGVGSPAFTPLVVTPGNGNGPLRGDVHVQGTSDDKFIAPSNWPHAGSYVFSNTSDTIHFMELQRVKPGTTDAQVQAAFNAPSQNGPPSFFLGGPTAGNDVVSPGNSVRVDYNLPAGTYVLLCFIADDMTGAPHAIMGMHKVITLH